MTRIDPLDHPSPRTLYRVSGSAGDDMQIGFDQQTDSLVPMSEEEAEQADYLVNVALEQAELGGLIGADDGEEIIYLSSGLSYIGAEGDNKGKQILDVAMALLPGVIPLTSKAAPGIARAVRRGRMNRLSRRIERLRRQGRGAKAAELSRRLKRLRRVSAKADQIEQSAPRQVRPRQPQPAPPAQPRSPYGYPGSAQPSRPTFAAQPQGRPYYPTARPAQPYPSTPLASLAQQFGSRQGRPAYPSSRGQGGFSQFRNVVQSFRGPNQPRPGRPAYPAERKPGSPGGPMGFLSSFFS